MKPETLEKLKDAKYFVCSDGSAPTLMKFTWINARKTNADYIDAFDYIGKLVVSVKRLTMDVYTDEF